MVLKSKILGREINSLSPPTESISFKILRSSALPVAVMEKWKRGTTQPHLLVGTQALLRMQMRL